MNTRFTPKHIVFDAVGTLFDVASMDERLDHYYNELASEIGVLWRSKQLEYCWLRTLMGSYVSFMQITADALEYAVGFYGFSLKPAVLQDLTEHYYHLEAYPDGLSLLKKMEGAIPMSILSNGNEELLEKLTTTAGTKKHFKEILSVDRVKKFKPHQEVYRMAEKELGLKAEEMLFVSSNPWDVAGSKEAGFHVAWINRKDMAMENLGVNQDMIVSSLEELGQGLETIPT